MCTCVLSKLYIKCSNNSKYIYSYSKYCCIFLFLNKMIYIYTFFTFNYIFICFFSILQFGQPQAQKPFRQPQAQPQAQPLCCSKCLPDGISCKCSLKSPKAVHNPVSKVSLLQSLFQRFLFAKVYCKGKPFFKGSSFARVPMQRQSLVQRHLFAKVVLLFACPPLSRVLFVHFLSECYCFWLAKIPLSQGVNDPVQNPAVFL